MRANNKEHRVYKDNRCPKCQHLVIHHGVYGCTHTYKEENLYIDCNCTLTPLEIDALNKEKADVGQYIDVPDDW